MGAILAGLGGGAACLLGRTRLDLSEELSVEHKNSNKKMVFSHKNTPQNITYKL
jgi:hypothetical protein